MWTTKTHVGTAALGCPLERSSTKNFSPQRHEVTKENKTTEKRGPRPRLFLSRGPSRLASSRRSRLLMRSEASRPQRQLCHPEARAFGGPKDLWTRSHHIRSGKLHRSFARKKAPQDDQRRMRCLAIGPVVPFRRMSEAPARHRWRQPLSAVQSSKARPRFHHRDTKAQRTVTNKGGWPIQARFWLEWGTSLRFAQEKVNVLRHDDISVDAKAKVVTRKGILLWTSGPSGPRQPAIKEHELYPRRSVINPSQRLFINFEALALPALQPRPGQNVLWPDYNNLEARVRIRE